VTKVLSRPWLGYQKRLSISRAWSPRGGFAKIPAGGSARELESRVLVAGVASLRYVVQ